MTNLLAIVTPASTPGTCRLQSGKAVAIAILVLGKGFGEGAASISQPAPKALGPLAETPKFSAFGKATARSFRLICSRSEGCPAHFISFAGGAGPGDGGLDLNYQLAERKRGPALLGSSQGHSRLYPLSLVDFGHAPERTRSFALPRNDLRSGSWNTRSGWFLHLFGYGQRLRRPYV